MTQHAGFRDLHRANLPRRDLELSTFLSRLHGRIVHHLSASECETMALTDLLGMADSDDLARWDDLRLSYTDPLGAPWLRATIAALYDVVRADDLVPLHRGFDGLRWATPILHQSPWTRRCRGKREPAWLGPFGW